MDEVIAEALRHINRKSKEHSIHVSSSQELLLARIDAKLIVQVLINLIDNAVKYTPAGSAIEICASQKDKWIVVSVSDNGPGIPAEQKPYIFDMFYSGANTFADSPQKFGPGPFLVQVHCHGSWRYDFRGG